MDLEKIGLVVTLNELNNRLVQMANDLNKHKELNEDIYELVKRLDNASDYLDEIISEVEGRWKTEACLKH